jgi:hypothetical protein
VVKVDVQGFEMRVLVGAEEVIERHHPAIMLRCHEEKCRAVGDSTVGIQQFLLERGYELSSISYHRKPLRVTVPQPVEDGTFIALYGS